MRGEEGPEDAREVLSLLRTHWRVPAFGAIAVLMALRSPQLLLEPRLWAEEGSVFFHHARDPSLLRALLFQYKEAGYLNLGAKLSTLVAARLVPLEWAPSVTTTIGFLAQLSSFGVILFGRSFLWRTPGKKLLACAALLLAPMTSGLVWFNSLHLPVWCGLLAFCLLMERTEEVGARSFRLYAAALCAAFLTGPYALFLLPLFAWKVSLTRSRRDRILLGIGLVAALFHGMLFLRAQGEVLRQRSPVERFDLAVAGRRVVAFQVVGPLLGEEAALRARRLMTGRARTKRSIWFSLLVTAASAGGILVLGWRRWPRSPEDLTAPAYFLMTGLVMFFSFGFSTDGRYAVLPGFLLTCILLAGVRLDRRALTEARSLLCWLLLATSMFVGARDYRGDPDLAYTKHSSHWREEVRRWRLDPTYRLAIWPCGPNGHWGLVLTMGEEEADSAK